MGMFKIIDVFMVLSALGAFVYLFLSLRDKTNMTYMQRRELFTGLFFIFWGLGDIFNRDAFAFGLAFLGLGIVWLWMFVRARNK